MALTADYSETVRARARRDPEFRECLLNGTIESLLAGEIGVARIKLRNYIVATVGFEQFGAMTGKPPASLAGMLGPEGAPSAGDLLEVIACTLRHEGLALRISTVPAERDGDDRAEVELVDVT